MPIRPSLVSTTITLTVKTAKSSGYIWLSAKGSPLLITPEQEQRELSLIVLSVGDLVNHAVISRAHGIMRERTLGVILDIYLRYWSKLRQLRRSKLYGGITKPILRIVSHRVGHGYRKPEADAAWQNKHARFRGRGSVRSPDLHTCYGVGKGNVEEGQGWECKHGHPHSICAIVYINYFQIQWDMFSFLCLYSVLTIGDLQPPCLTICKEGRDSRLQLEYNLYWLSGNRTTTCHSILDAFHV